MAISKNIIFFKTRPFPFTGHLDDFGDHADYQAGQAMSLSNIKIYWKAKTRLLFSDSLDSLI